MGGGHSTDEKEYRHAFLIVEARKGTGGSHPRHVLCAESDEERDAWVDMLVRYFTGQYSEESLSVPASQLPVAVSPSYQLGSATGSGGGQGGGVFSPVQYSMDEYNFNSTSNSNRSASPVKGTDPPTVERSASFQKSHPDVTSVNSSNVSLNGPTNNVGARKILDRLAGLPSSLPDPSSSPLSAVASSVAVAEFLDRPNSDLGHYSLSQEKFRKTQSPERHRKSIHPPTSSSQNDTLIVSGSAEGAVDRSTSPSKVGGSNKVKISGPMNGMPIPFGCDFGGGRDREKEKDREKEERDGTGGVTGGNERREKARSRFWPGWNSKTGNGNGKLFYLLLILELNHVHSSWRKTHSNSGHSSCCVRRPT